MGRQRHNNPHPFYCKDLLQSKKGGGEKRIILGLTGSFGSGKTTVAKIFKSLGCNIIDADRIAHRIINANLKIYKKIIDTFGRDILKKNETIDRDKLGRIVFNNKNWLKILNKIIHPQVIRIIKNQIKNSRSKVIILDAPLLIEVGLEDLVDKLIVVKIKRNKQIERILKKTFLSKTDILKRIRHQLPLSEKLCLADFVIDNSGNLKYTRRQVREIWNKLQPRKHGKDNN